MGFRSFTHFPAFHEPRDRKRLTGREVERSMEAAKGSRSEHRRLLLPMFPGRGEKAIVWKRRLRGN